MTTTLDWTRLGRDVRQSALDAHDELVPVAMAYSFMLDNPECFLDAHKCSRCGDRDANLSYKGIGYCAQCATSDETKNGDVAPWVEWPVPMPFKPPTEFIAAYYGAA